jgi:hypothetical protein
MDLHPEKGKGHLKSLLQYCCEGFVEGKVINKLKSIQGARKSDF